MRRSSPWSSKCGRQPGIIEALDGFGRTYLVFGGLLIRKRGHVDGDATLREVQCFLKQSSAAVDVGGMEGPRGEFGLVQSPSDKFVAARTIPQMKVEYTRFSSHQPRYVAFARHTKELIERGLAGAVVGNRQLAEPDDLLQMHDIAAN